MNPPPFSIPNPWEPNHSHRFMYVIRPASPEPPRAPGLRVFECNWLFQWLWKCSAQTSSSGVAWELLKIGTKLGPSPYSWISISGAGLRSLCLTSPQVMCCMLNLGDHWLWGLNETVHDLNSVSSTWKWKSLSRVWVCAPVDYSVHGILQVRILEWRATPFSRDLPNPGIETGSPALQADSLPAELPGKVHTVYS